MQRALEPFGFELPTVTLYSYVGERVRHEDGSWEEVTGSPLVPSEFTEAHFTLSDYYREYGSLYNLDSYFKFTIVRNPWSRMVSYFHYHSGMASNKDRPFGEWLREVFKCDGTNNLCSREPEFEERHYSNQIEWLSVDNQNRMDFIGSFSSLASDFNHICDKLNLGEVELSLFNPQKEGVDKKKEHAFYLQSLLR